MPFATPVEDVMVVVQIQVLSFLQEKKHIEIKAIINGEIFFIVLGFLTKVRFFMIP